MTTELSDHKLSLFNVLKLWCACVSKLGKQLCAWNEFFIVFNSEVWMIQIWKKKNFSPCKTAFHLSSKITLLRNTRPEFLCYLPFALLVASPRSSAEHGRVVMDPNRSCSHCMGTCAGTVQSIPWLTLLLLDKCSS